MKARSKRVIALLCLNCVIAAAVGTYISKSGILEPEPINVIEYVEAGHTSLSKGHCHEALGPLTEAIRLDPDCSSAYYLRGKAYVGLEDYGRALDDFDAAISLDPKDRRLVEWRANAARQIDGSP